jgi:hypothetical protein
LNLGFQIQRSGVSESTSGGLAVPPVCADVPKVQRDALQVVLCVLLRERPYEILDQQVKSTLAGSSMSSRAYTEPTCNPVQKHPCVCYELTTYCGLNWNCRFHAFNFSQVHCSEKHPNIFRCKYQRWLEEPHLHTLVQTTFMLVGDPEIYIFFGKIHWSSSVCKASRGFVFRHG